METNILVFVFFAFSTYSVMVSSQMTVNSTCPEPLPPSPSTGFQCTVTTQTGWYANSESDDNFYIKFFDKANRQSQYVNMDNRNRDDFERGHLDTFDVYVIGVWPPLSHIAIEQDDDDGWFLVYVDVYCPSVEVDMHFYWNRFLDDNALIYIIGTNNRKCPTLEQIADGSLTCTDNSIWGSRCSYSCIGQQFRLHGPDCLHCQENQRWSSPANSTTCEVIACPERNLTNGSQLCTYNITYNSSCTYDCNEGFQLIGSNSATCLSSGEWSIQLPVCEAVRCPEQAIRNGSVQCSNGTFAMSLCDYNCDQGLILRGSNSSLCQTSGQWSGELPTCEGPERVEIKLRSGGWSDGAVIGVVIGVVILVTAIAVFIGGSLWRRLWKLKERKSTSREVKRGNDNKAFCDVENKRNDHFEVNVISRSRYEHLDNAAPRTEANHYSAWPSTSAC